MSTGPRAARVRTGIALMDLHHGPQWVWKVNPDTVDIDSPCLCVVGQANNCWDGISYWDALEGMGIEGEPADAASGFYPEADEEHVLNRLWSFAIRRLREQRPRGAVAA